MTQSPINDFLLYLRLVEYAVAALGVIMVAVINFQEGKDKLMLSILSSMSLLLLAWLLVSAASTAFPDEIIMLRTFIITPFLTILTVLLWLYVIRRSKHK